MHGDVEQEGLYQYCEFHYPWGRGFASLTTPPILFKLDMVLNTFGIKMA
jgi:hypothetical protein